MAKAILLERIRKKGGNMKKEGCMRIIGWKKAFDKEVINNAVRLSTRLRILEEREMSDYEWVVDESMEKDISMVRIGLYLMEMWWCLIEILSW